MTITEKIKRRFIIALSVLAAACAVTVAIANVKTASAELNLSSELKKEYILGSELTVPDGDISYGGETKAATSSVVFPSGKIATEKSVVLSEYGKYKVVYSVGASVSEEKYFDTVKPILENVDEYEYKSVKFENKDYFGGFNTDYTRKTDALVIDFPSEDAPLYINKIINLDDLSDRGVLFSFGIEGDKDPVKDANRTPYNYTFIKVYDASNPDVYFEVRLMIGQRTWYYAVTNDANEGFGWENHIRNTSTVEKGKNASRYSTSFAQAGAYVVENIRGLPTASVIYDKEDNAVYAISEEVDGNMYKKIADFDDGEQFENAWSGFKSGDVLISVTSCGTESNVVIDERGTAKMAIETIGGEKVTAKTVDATQKDVSKPYIDIDFGDGLDKTDFAGSIGVPFALFAAKVYDNAATGLAYDVKTYYAKGTDKESEVLITNGNFSPSKIGVYTVEYSATDYSDNVATRSFTVSVFDAEEYDKTATLSADVQKTYVIKDKVAFEQKIVIGGKQYAPYVVVYSPSGERKILGEKETLSLNEIGVYKVNFVYQTADGEVYIVKKDFFSVNSSFSLIEGVKSVALGGVTYKVVDNLMGHTFDYEKTAEAILVDLPSETTPLTYGETVDLNRVGQRASLIKIGIAGSKKSTENVTNGAFFIKVSDSVNPNVFFEIRVTVEEAWYVSVANSANHDEFGGAAKINYLANDSKFKGYPRYPSTWQTCGNALIESIYGISSVEFFYESSSKTVFASRETHEGKSYVRVAEFNDTEQFSKSWQGFTSGKVNISIGYAKKGVTAVSGGNDLLAIEKIAGLTAKQVAEKSGTALEESYVKTEIDDFAGYKNVAIDVDKIVKISGDYYGYAYDITDTTYKWYSVKTSGKTLLETSKTFTPAENGLYLLEITSKDYFGNKFVEEKYFGVSDGLGGKDYQVVTDGESIKSEYNVGAKINIPEYRFQLGERSEKATVRIYCPDGKVYSSTEVLLSTAGKYVAEFSATIDSEYYSVKQTFTVLEKVFSNDRAAWFNGDGTYAKGMLLTLGQDEVLTYNKTINLYELGEKTRIFDIIAKPTVTGQPDFNAIHFRFTDAYDPDNWVEVIADGYNMMYLGLACWSVKLPDQPSAALYNWNGYIYKDYPGRGAMTNTPFAGTVAGAVDPVPFGLYYDKTEQAFYCYNPSGNPNPCFIADMDDERYFSEPFKGFTTGEVLFSVYGDKFTTNESLASIIVQNICGEQVTAETNFIDGVSPRMVLNNITFPSGATGLRYKLPNLTAMDNLDGQTQVKVRVYYGYEGNSPVSVAVNDSSFLPRRAGKYTIVYTATDKFGNTERIVREVQIDKTANPVTVSLPLSTVSKSLGEVAEIETAKYGGGYGALTLKIKLIAPDGTSIDVRAGDYANLLKQGEYKVKYTVTDYHGQRAEAEYAITVTENAAPVFTSGFGGIPRCLINNNGCYLPVVTAAKYVNGVKTEANVEIYIKDANRTTPALLDGNYCVPSVKNGGDVVEIIYRIAGSDVEKVFTVPVKDAGYKADGNHELDIKEFFSTENATVTANENDVAFGYVKDAGISFVNPVLSAGFTLKATVEDVNAEAVTVKLTDYANAKNAFTVKFIKTGETWYMQAGAGDLTAIDGFGATDMEIKISKDEKTLTVNGNQFDLETISAGAYNGFASKKVYVDIEITKVKGSGAIKILQINNQLIKRLSNDVTSPEFYTEQLEGGAFAIGSTYALKPAYAADVLDMGIITGLTVRLPNKRYAVASDGTILNGAPFDKEYTITLDSYGIYSVSYTSVASMFSGQRGLTYTVSVFDEVAPTVALNGKNTEESAKLNSTVTLPSVTVADNLTATEEIIVRTFVISPDDIITEITEDTVLNENCMGGNILSTTEIKVTMKGVYRILFRAEDAAGNVAATEYRITVK